MNNERIIAYIYGRRMEDEYEELIIQYTLHKDRNAIRRHKENITVNTHAYMCVV
jgi:hypothetical protein